MPEMLIIKPSALRDIVHGLQVAASIKAQKPEWRISWVVRDIFSPLVRACSAIDQVYAHGFEDTAPRSGKKAPRRGSRGPCHN